MALGQPVEGVDEVAGVPAGGVAAAHALILAPHGLAGSSRAERPRTARPPAVAPEEQVHIAETVRAAAPPDPWPAPRATGPLHAVVPLPGSKSVTNRALVLAAVQDKPAREVAAMDVAQALAPFDLKNQLSSNRTQGVPNMIALIHQVAARYAAA